MIRVNQIKLEADHTQKDLVESVKEALRLHNSNDFNIKIVKRSIDSRHKPKIYFVYAVNVTLKAADLEEKILKHNKNRNVIAIKEMDYVFPGIHLQPERKKDKRPVIVGFGPAGMFCALFLARCGLSPLVLERGECVEQRIKTVEELWDNNSLNTNSNIQFGEGGAGTFSDGKLNTMIKDPSGRIKTVLETFVKAGADSSILYLNKPHIGTDVLQQIVRNIRMEILRCGGEIRFQTYMEKIFQKDGELKAVCIRDVSKEKSELKMIPCSELVIATGHSSRDTFKMLESVGLRCTAKAFAVGLRIEHPQKLINEYAYGKNIQYNQLPTADYKVTHQCASGRGVYSFCMCPGGYVVNASSEQGMTAVNGMSYSGRDARNANSALIVTVTPQDYTDTSPLAGVEFQRKLEKAAFREGKGGIPIQLSGDFKKNIKSTGLGRVVPCIKGQYEFSNLRTVLPEYLSNSIIEALEGFEKIIPGFGMEDAVFSGIESRTSSPVRILRDENGESNIKGIFPCGEGAGYAGGIMSAAVDGMKIAEKIVQKYIK